jgi:murein DD-endopeptidase MepM/ murein hydrolase activator NlpD
VPVNTMRLKRQDAPVHLGLWGGIALLSLSMFLMGVAKHPSTPSSLISAYQGGYSDDVLNSLALPRHSTLSPAKAPLHSLEVPAAIFVPEESQEQETALQTPDAGASNPLSLPRTGPVPLPPRDALPKKVTPTLVRFAARIGRPTLILKEQVLQAKSGDNAMSLLKAAGAHQQEAAAMVEALKKWWNPSALKSGQQLTVVRGNGDDTTIYGLYVRTSALNDVVVERSEDGFIAGNMARPITTETVLASGMIRSTFLQAANYEGLPVAVRQKLMRAFSYSVDFERDVSRGDKFEVLYEQKRDEDGNVLQADTMLTATLTLNGKASTVYSFKQGAAIEFFSAAGQSVRKALLRTPVDHVRITSGFGMRWHPVLGFNKLHKGVDFGVPIGTPIRAAGDGTIKVAGRFGGYGNYLRLQHSATYDTAYGHISRFAKGIKPGVAVRQGQIIAYSGNTGRSTGPHLHYEVIKNNVPVNPQTASVTVDNRLSNRDLAQFQQQVAKVTALLRQERSASTVAQLNR